MKVGGRDFDLTKEQVEERMSGKTPELIQKHAVEVNGQMFPPKQVLGQVTGWSRTSFTTMEAQRVLTRLGFVCEARGNWISQAGRFVAEVARDPARRTVTDHGDIQHLRGFTRAMSITLQQFDERLDDLRQQMKGSGVSPGEQALYIHLEELKADIEAGCDHYWNGLGVDWRPLKPVAKAIIQQADE